MEALLRILEENKPDFDFSGRTDLATSGDIDSFDIISIVSDVQEEFGITVPVEKILPENFDSVEALWALIESLL